MLGRKKPDSSGKKSRSKESQKQLYNMGLVPGMNDDDESDDEAALEAELQNLMYGKSKATKPKKRKSELAEPDLDKMVAACMADVPEDEDINDEDIEDEDLLGELAEFEDDEEEIPVAKPQQTPAILEPMQPMSSSQTQPQIPSSNCDENRCAGQSLLSVIDSRLEMYAKAEKNAKEAGEASRARRFARGLATLTDLRKKVKAGKAVDENDIPPPLATVLPASGPKPTEIEAPASPEKVAKFEDSSPKIDTETLSMLQNKRSQYKTHALASKQSGDKQAAILGLAGVKKCEELIARVQNGEAVNLTELPSLEAKPTPVERTFSRDDPIVMPENPDDIPPANRDVYGAPPPPKTAEEALRQRLEKYRHDEAKAKEEGNNSRARRLGRICKQYQEAIVMHKKGKLALVLADLPTPPGFGPIPLENQAPVNQGPPPDAGSKAPPPPAGPGSRPPNAPAAKKKPMSLQEKQVIELEKRQNQFKSAALTAKKAGQIEQAKEYLRKAKGFDSLIEAAKSGLPVDFKSLPVAPQAVRDVAMDFEIVSTEECHQAGQENSSSDLSGTNRQEMYKKLETDLVNQIKMCQANRLYFKSTGDVASANKFHQMEEHTKKDLDSLRFAFRRGDPVPKFHYEVRSFSKVVICSDLTDNELEFAVVQGINLNVAKDAHTYCRLEFPYPKETPFKDKSGVIKDTNCPEYNHAVKIPLNLKDKGCQRIFKRQSAKVEVWNKVGFLRSDVCLGSVQVKLQQLESKCELHDTFPLMDGRRAVGGQLEIRMRVRNPIVTKQIEKVEEKWLVISFK